MNVLSLESLPLPISSPYISILGREVSQVLETSEIPGKDGGIKGSLGGGNKNLKAGLRIIILSKPPNPVGHRI